MSAGFSSFPGSSRAGRGLGFQLGVTGRGLERVLYFAVHFEIKASTEVFLLSFHTSSAPLNPRVNGKSSDFPHLQY